MSGLFCYQNRTVLDYWQFASFYSLYFSYEKKSLISTYSLRRVSLTLTLAKIRISDFHTQPISDLNKSAKAGLLRAFALAMTCNPSNQKSWKKVSMMLNLALRRCFKMSHSENSLNLWILRFSWIRQSSHRAEILALKKRLKPSPYFKIWGKADSN